MITRGLCLFLAALLVTGACDQVSEAVDPPARAAEAASAFASAWTEGDTEAMAAVMDEATRWDAERLDAFFERATPDDVIESTEMALTGTVEQPPDDQLEGEGGAAPEATAPYTVTIESEAASAPVVVEGELVLLYDPDRDRWEVEFSKDLLWPEHPGNASRFAIEERWPRRAAILDRTGRKLATGPDEERTYPFGALAGTTIGHLGPPEDSTRLVGASGLEAALDEQLAGIPTTKLVLLGRPEHACRRERRKSKQQNKRKDARPQEEAPKCEVPVLEVLGRVRGERSRDVKTTLHVDVQRAAESAFGATIGGSVVMDPETGDLLAVVSSSPFRPQDYVGVAGVEPFNRALSGGYPPGSALKVMTGAAALEEGVVKESTMLTGPAEYKGVRNFESGEFGSLDFATAVKFSVNTAFAQIAEDLGARRLTRYAELFGFNEAPSMPLEARTSSFPFPEDEGDLMWSSIGQAQVLASPLEMATVAATIANDGKRMEPRILLRSPKRGERVVSRRTARTMTTLMENVVKGGTGTGAAIGGAQVAGKTGTAEVDVDGKRMNHAWFISFAPSTAPKVAVSVVSELGGVGGRVAAPLAGRILSAVLPLVR